MNNITEILFQQNHARLDKVAFVDEKGIITYRQLEDRTRRMSAWLVEQGIKPGDRVVLLLTDKIDTVVSILSTMLVGAVAVMTNPNGQQENIKYQIGLVTPGLILAEEKLIDFLKEVSTVPVKTTDEVINSVHKYAPWSNHDVGTLDDPALMLWTSGTSSKRPKVVVHLAKRMLDQGRLTGATAMEITSEDRIYSTGKLFFAYGFVIKILSAMWVGAEVYLDNALALPAHLRQIVKDYRPTLFCSVPVLFSQMLSEPVDMLPHARCVSSGDRLPDVLIDRWRTATGTTIHNCYGLTEFFVCSFNHQGDSAIGTPIPEQEIRIVNNDNQVLPANEVGHIQIKTITAGAGYYLEPEVNAQVFEPEWKPTGDLGYRDADNRFYGMGRAGDIIKVNGLFVNPGELEESLLSYPGVDQAAVVGKELRNDLVKIEAYIVVSADIKVDTNDLRRWMLTKYEKYSCPRTIHVVQELPRTDTGKLQRFKLKQAEGILI